MTRFDTLRWRGGRLALAAAAVALTAAACTFVSPATATKPYNAGEGTSATIDLASGEVLTIRNIVVVSEAAGEPGQVLGAIDVTGSEGVSVSLAADGSSDSPTTINVEPGEVVILSPDEEDVVLPTVDADPGSFTRLTALVPQGGTVTWDVPVVLPEGSYEGLAPEPVLPEPTETATTS